MFFSWNVLLIYNNLNFLLNIKIVIKYIIYFFNWSTYQQLVFQIFKLLKEGFDRDIPTFFAIPGVTYYITLPVFRQTLQKIKLISAEGSKVAFDFPDESTFCAGCPNRVKRLSLITEGLGEPMLHGFSVEEVKKVLEKTGFEVEEHLDPESIQERFFENRSDEQRAFENIHFILARKSTNSI